MTLLDKLHLDPHSQGETQEVTVQIDRICRQHFPRS